MAVPLEVSTESPDSGREYEQHYHSFENGTWKLSLTQSPPSAAPPDVFSVMSWNIDFMRPAPDERMKAVLDYLSTHEWRLRRPIVIMFNDMVVSDLKLIQCESWVRESYNVTDLTGEAWIH